MSIMSVNPKDYQQKTKHQVRNTDLLKEEFVDFDVDIDPGSPPTAKANQNVVFHGDATRPANFMAWVTDVTGLLLAINTMSPTQQVDKTWSHTFKFTDPALPVQGVDYRYTIQGTY